MAIAGNDFLHCRVRRLLWRLALAPHSALNRQCSSHDVERRRAWPRRPDRSSGQHSIVWQTTLLLLLCTLHLCFSLTLSTDGRLPLLFLLLLQRHIYMILVGLLLGDDGLAVAQFSLAVAAAGGGGVWPRSDHARCALCAPAVGGDARRAAGECQAARAHKPACWASADRKMLDRWRRWRLRRFCTATTRCSCSPCCSRTGRWCAPRAGGVWRAACRSALR